MAGIALTLLEIRVLGHVAHAADEHGACRRTVSEVHGRRVRVLATPLGPLDRIELPAEVHGKAFTSGFKEFLGGDNLVSSGVRGRGLPVAYASAQAWL
jgi:hypothetical protein